MTYTGLKLPFVITSCEQEEVEVLDMEKEVLMCSAHWRCSLIIPVEELNDSPPSFIRCGSSSCGLDDLFIHCIV